MNGPEIQVNLDVSESIKGPRKPFVPYRYFIMFMLLIAATVVLAVRCTINVSIIAMVRKPTGNLSVTLNEKQFDWSQKDQGIILGSYFYTYTSVQIFAGLLADKFNVVHLLAMSQAMATFCTFITPIAASYSIYHLVVVRMVMGLVHGVTYPCLYCLIEKWFPPNEISFGQGLLSAGADFGTALVAIFSAWISQQGLWGGWPATFYIIGIVDLIFAIVWVLFVTKDPFSNRFVSDYEKQYLSRTIVNAKVKPSWRRMLTSSALWSVFLAKGTLGLSYSVINSKIPVYLDSVLGYKLENNGLINAIFYVVVATSQLSCGPISKYIITKGWIDKTKTRKIFESIALAGITASLVTVCVIDNTQLIVVCLVFSMFFYGFNLGGDVPIVPEMAPDLVGTTFGFANLLSSASGFIAPALVGAILGNDAGSQSKWMRAFEIVAGLQFTALVLFNIFATAEPQSWGSNSYIDDPEETKKAPQW